MEHICVPDSASSCQFGTYVLDGTKKGKYNSYYQMLTRVQWSFINSGQQTIAAHQKPWVNRHGFGLQESQIAVEGDISRHK